MYYDQEKDVSSFVAGVLLGAVIGAGLALVMTPGRDVARLRHENELETDALAHEAIMMDLQRRGRAKRRRRARH